MSYYNDTYTYYNSTEDLSQLPSIEFWNGGILFVLLFDALIFLIGFIIFVLVRRASLTQGDALVNVTRKNSKFRLWYSKLLHRHSERKRDEVNSWFGWIPATIKADQQQVLDECGRDGFLYLRFQRLLIIVLGTESVIVMPILLATNLKGTAEIEGFGITTTNHLLAGSEYLWITTISVIFLTLLVLVAIWRTINAVNKNTTIEEMNSSRLFTAKIENFPRNEKNEKILFEFLDEVYPNAVLQVYICLNMNELQRVYSKLSKVEEHILHNEVEFSTLGKRPVTYSSKFAREICCPGLCDPKTDALELYYAKKYRLEREINFLSKKDYPSTGVCFVTFKEPKYRRQFIKDFRTTKLPRTSLSKRLKIHHWLVTGAPNSGDIRWKSLRVGLLEYATRFILVNIFLFIFLFFFTTPVAMMGGLKEYTVDYFNFNFYIVSYLESKKWGTILLGYLPSLLLLLLTFIMPHILYCKFLHDHFFFQFF